MKRFVRVAVALATLSLAWWVSAASPPSRAPVNAAGQPLLSVDGTRIKYRKEDLKRAPPAQRVLGESQTAGGLATWGYAAYGSGIGLSGLVAGTVGIDREIYAAGSTTTFGVNDHWYALRWNRAAARFDQVYVSDHVPQGIRQMVLVRMNGLTNHLVVGLSDGTLRRYDQQAKALVSTGPGPCSTRWGLRALAAADFDQNGSDELVHLCNDETLVVEGPGYAGWSLAGVGGSEIAVGQMDNDPALEIATTSGRVVDSTLHAVQWTWPQGFGLHLQAADIDGDGRDEIVASDEWYWIYAYDVDRQLPKWSLRAELDIGALQLADLDGDGTKELLVGDGQWGSVHVYRTSNQQLLGSVDNPDHGVTRIAVVDLDGDDKPELIWGAGHTSSAADHLLVGDWPTRSVRWKSLDLVGPFLGPVLGDLDGDGVLEVVIASRESDAEYAGGRIVVFDSRTMSVRAVSDSVVEWSSHAGVRDLKLRDVNGDGRLDVLIATDEILDGVLEAYSLSRGNLMTRVWRNSVSLRNTPFRAVEFGDVDGDGQAEVLGGVGHILAGQENYGVYAYDAATGAEKWHTKNVGGDILTLLLGDYDGDGVVEIAAAVADRGVYIFSGVTHQLKAFIEAPGVSSLTRLDAYSIPRLLIGESNGRAHVHAFDGGQLYPEVQSLQLGTARIDGITVGTNRSWWVASGGTLSRYAGTSKLFESASYGTGFGRQVESIGFRGAVFSAGLYGLHRVELTP